MPMFEGSAVERNEQRTHVASLLFEECEVEVVDLRGSEQLLGEVLSLGVVGLDEFAEGKRGVVEELHIVMRFKCLWIGKLNA